MSVSIYTYNLHKSLSTVFDLGFKEIPELSDQKMFESTNIKHDGTIIPWNKGKKGLQECWSKGKKVGPNKKLSEYRSGKTYEELYGIVEATKQKKLRSDQNSGSGNPMFGRKHKKTTKKLISEKAIGRKTGRTSEDFTQEWKENIKVGVKKQKLYTCPKCEKTMTAGNYIRWGHGDGCNKWKH